jgi:signal transduction histidine kinase
MDAAFNQWQIIIDAMDGLAMVLDINGNIKIMNSATKQLYFPAKNTITNIAAMDNRAIKQQVVILLRSLSHTQPPLTCQICDDDGKTWDIRVNLIDETNEANILLTLNDCSQQSQLRTQPNQTIAALSSLVSGIAHEVRNPLFGVLATLDAFEARFTNQQEYKRYIDILREELNRLTQLMQELLEYGKTPHLTLSPTPLKEVLTQAMEECQLLATTAQVKIVSHSHEDAIVSLIDRQHLLRAFQQLLQNAILRSPQESTISLEMEKIDVEDKSWINCRIRDNGPAFPLEDLSRVFEPFFIRGRGATGLALSIVQRIIAEHQGKVFAHNHPIAGTVISVWLPFA